MPLPFPITVRSPISMTGSRSGTWPGDTPADRLEYGPIIEPAPMRMYSSPNSAATGKHPALPWPKPPKRRPRRLLGPIAPYRVAWSQRQRTASPVTSRNGSSGRTDADIVGTVTPVRRDGHERGRGRSASLPPAAPVGERGPGSADHHPREEGRAHDDDEDQRREHVGPSGIHRVGGPACGGERDPHDRGGQSHGWECTRVDDETAPPSAE